MGGDDVSTTSPYFINCLHWDQDGPESTPAPGKRVGRTLKLCHWIFAGCLQGNWQVDVEEGEGELCEVIGANSHGTMSDLWPCGRMQLVER
jgi:hypothetical protein